ncbi:MAG: hypothetical protein ACRYGK_04170 [Janthinobacterium lividum]
MAIGLATVLALFGSFGSFGSNQAFAATAAGSAISNQAQASYVDAASTTRTISSNTVVTTVQQVGAVTIGSNGSKNIGPGQTASFTHTITNTGNGPDTFALSTTNSGGFAYSTVQFFADANGDGIADNNVALTNTGVIAAGASFQFIAVATVPSATAAGLSNNLVVTATSQYSASTASNTDTTTVSSISNVDITSNSAGPGAPGAGAGPEAAAVTTNTVNPGATTRFTMYLNNPGNASDSFTLNASTDASFAANILPSGWVVVYRDAGGNPITSANVGAGSNTVVFADVTIPGGASVALTDLYFRAAGNVSGVSDRLHDAVNVVAVTVQTAVVITQALDAACDGVADTAYMQTPITTGASPNACVRYRVTTTNISNATVTTVVVYNNTPAFSTYQGNSTAHPATTSQGTFSSQPADAGTGQFVIAVGTLTAGRSQVLEYGVKISP